MPLTLHRHHPYIVGDHAAKSARNVRYTKDAPGLVMCVACAPLPTVPDIDVAPVRMPPSRGAQK